MTTQDRANAILRNELGGMRLTLIQQQAELEMLREENARLRAEAVKAGLWKPDVSTTETARVS